MMEFGACPRCNQDISDERKQSAVIVCDSCGWVISSSESQFREKGEKRFVRFAVILSFIMVAGFLQLAVWDNHALEVLPLQFKELIGSSSNEDLETMAQICLERKKLDCVERDYSKLGERDMKNLLRLGKFQMNREHYNEAVNTYRNFFAKGGIDLEGSYLFARALGQVGMVDEASKYFDYVLGAKPDVLQVTVIQNYVKLLMEANRLDQAKKLIESVRNKSDTSAYFMDNEFKQIQQRTGTKS
jgi:tetratricopeptide (TPR) repeat protein